MQTATGLGQRDARRTQSLREGVSPDGRPAPQRLSSAGGGGEQLQGKGCQLSFSLLVDHYQTRRLMGVGIAFTVKVCPMHTQAPFPGGSGSPCWQQPSGAAVKPGGTATARHVGRSLQDRPSGSCQRHFPKQLVWGQREGSGVWYLPPAEPGAPCPLLCCWPPLLPCTPNQHVFQKHFTYSLLWLFQTAAFCLC